MNDSTTLKAGTILRNTYTIVRVLGQGGFGITYLAIDSSLDRKVAIKEFFPKDFCDREGDTSHVTLGTRSNTDFVAKLKAKFLKEARNIAKFDHPGIIRIHAAFEENNTAYYVMDYIEGLSLSEIVKRDGPIPEQKAIGYIKKVGEALEYVHNHRMNHLDVKPANIMVRESDDRPILIDFGLSKQYDSEGHQTSTTPTGISHGYAPMEQYNDVGIKEFSPQTDLYSLAATLYYILSGITPPHATKLIENDLTFPASIPINLIMPISKAMSSKRCNRHETVNEFVNDLSTPKAKEETEIADEKIIQKPKLKPKTTPKPNSLSKSRLFIGMGIAIVVIASIVFVGSKLTKGNSSNNIALNEMSSILSNMDSLSVDLNEATLKQINSKNIDGRGIDKYFTVSNAEEFSHLLSGDSTVLFWHKDDYSYAPNVDSQVGCSIMTFDDYRHCIDNKNQPLAIMIDGQWGFCNARGNILIEAEYEEVKPFVNGLAAVMKDDKWGFIDTSGKLVLPIKYDGVGSFVESSKYNSRIAFIEDGNQLYLINEEGHRINDLSFDNVGEWGGKKRLLCSIEINDKWGYIDNDANIVIKPQFDEANDFAESSQYAVVKENSKWGVIDENGNYMLSPQFTDEYGPAIVNGTFLLSKSKDGYTLFDISSKKERFIRHFA